MTTINQHENDNINSNNGAAEPQQGRILSKKSLDKLAKFHSYVTYFLLGSFVGLAAGGTLDKLIGIPEFITSHMNLESLSVAIGSSIAILSKILFSLK